MEYKTYEYPSFNLYTVKTNRFKTVQMEIIFRDEVKSEDLLTKTFLVDLMTDVSEKYKTRKEMVKHLEELYQASFYGVTNKVGNVVMTSFVLNFLNPEYVSEENYLEEVIKLPCEAIMKPFIKAEEFDIKNFNIVKNRLHDEILGINEDINRVSLKSALKYLDESPSKYSVMGSLEELDKITPKTLASAYEDLIANNKCDIFVVGNIDMDKVANFVFKYFKNPTIKTKDYSLYVDNKIPKKVKIEKDKSKFLETNLVNIYGIENLNDKEKITTMHFYNYLLGGGGLNTKLYQLLREKNSLCYGVRSVYLKYDNLLMIQTSIDKKDIRRANSLIKLAFKEMKLGKFTNEELEAAKSSFIFSLNLALDDPAGILNNYVFHVISGLPLIEDRMKLINDVTKEEIVALSSRIKPILEFVLEGDTNGNN